MQNTFNEGARDITPNDEGVREISREEGFGNGISAASIVVDQKDEGFGIIISPDPIQVSSQEEGMGNGLSKDQEGPIRPLIVRP